MTDIVERLNAALSGRYAIERELGEGGMATVYLADDLKHERKVALKVLKPAPLAAARLVYAFVAEHDETPSSPGQLNPSLAGYSIEVGELGWKVTSADLHFKRGGLMDQAPFYDDIAEYYDLIYADWEDSMRRHGAAISQMLPLRESSAPEGGSRVLDVSAGIGTQALPLAALGFDVAARDLSPGAIARLSREARQRGLAIDAAQADMREVADSVDGLFDAVISFDNSIPHLLTDLEITAAFRGFSRLLKPGGSLLISVRDYDEVDRSPSSVHQYGERTRDGRTFRLGQEWKWVDSSRYRTTMLIEESVGGAWIDLVRSEVEYYAVSVPRLLALMEEVGLTSSRVKEVPFFQPVLRGSASKDQV